MIDLTAGEEGITRPKAKAKADPKAKAKVEPKKKATVKAKAKAKPKAKAKAPAKAPANPFDGLSKDHAQMVMAFATMLRAKK